MITTDITEVTSDEDLHREGQDDGDRSPPLVAQIRQGTPSSMPEERGVSAPRGPRAAGRPGRGGGQVQQSAPRTSARAAVGTERPPRARLLQKFAELADERDPSTRSELIEAHLDLADHLARRFVGRGVDLDDLIQVARLGLVKAVDGFDLGRGVQFSTYAVPTILGELKRHFRDRAWAIRVPRRLHDLSLRIKAEEAVLEQELGRSPTTAEVATRACASKEDVLSAFHAGRSYALTSLDGAPPGEPGTAQVSDLVGEEDPGFCAVEARLGFEALVANLPEREQCLLRLRFVDRLTQAEIAQRLGVSQMHVSRLLAQLIARLPSGETGVSAPAPTNRSGGRTFSQAARTPATEHVGNRGNRGRR